MAARFKNPLHAAEVPGHVASDLATGAYSRDDLQAWFDAGGAVAYPSDLKRVIPKFAAEHRREVFAAELRRIHDGGLTRAAHRKTNPPRRARVVFANDRTGLLLLEEAVGGWPAASAEELRRRIKAADDPRFPNSATIRGLRDRLAAVEVGGPDPGAREPERHKLEIRTAKELNEWEFSAPPAVMKQPKAHPAEAVLP